MQCSTRWSLLLTFIAVFGSPVAAQELRIATLAPADSQWMQDMVAGGERVRELTGALR
jgi:hypothetical protein